MAAAARNPRSGPGAGAALSDVDDLDHVDLADSNTGAVPGRPLAAGAQSTPQPVHPQMAKVKVDSDDDDDDDEDEDPPDPQFYLGSATVIGMACLCTFIFNFITRFGELSGPLVWIVTSCGGLGCFLVPFMFYCCTSKALRCCDRTIDGLLGGAPFLPIGGGVFYVYVALALAVRNVAGASIEDQILMYINVPAYMTMWLPLFVFMMHLQRGDARDAEAAKAKAREAARRKPRKTNRLTASIVVFRRSIVAFVCSCCLAAYGVLPLFGISWLCVGLYRAYLVHIAIPICVLAVTTLLIIVLSIFKKTRRFVLLPVRFIVAFCTLPLVGWSPRAGDLIPKYDNSLTADRRVADVNATIEEANKAAAAGETQRAKALFAAAERRKEDICRAGTRIEHVAPS